jgi:hypothetical protein
MHVGRILVVSSLNLSSFLRLHDLSISCQDHGDTPHSIFDPLRRILLGPQL